MRGSDDRQDGMFSYISLAVGSDESSASPHSRDGGRRADGDANRVSQGEVPYVEMQFEPSSESNWAVWEITELAKVWNAGFLRNQGMVLRTLNGVAHVFSSKGDRRFRCSAASGHPPKTRIYTRAQEGRVCGYLAAPSSGLIMYLQSDGERADITPGQYTPSTGSPPCS